MKTPICTDYSLFISVLTLLLLQLTSEPKYVKLDTVSNLYDPISRYVDICVTCIYFVFSSFIYIEDNSLQLNLLQISYK